MFHRLTLVAILVAGPGALWCQNTPGMALTVLQETRLAQQAVTSPRRLVRQRSRWFQGHLQCMKLIPQGPVMVVSTQTKTSTQ